MPLYKYISNRVLTLVENILLGEKLSEYHTGYRAFSRIVLETLPLERNSDDFLFDNQMLAQALYFGFRVGEISCPAKYFPEASSINFRAAWWAGRPQDGGLPPQPNWGAVAQPDLRVGRCPPGGPAERRVPRPRPADDRRVFGADAGRPSSGVRVAVAGGRRRHLIVFWRHRTTTSGLGRQPCMRQPSCRRGFLAGIRWASPRCAWQLASADWVSPLADVTLFVPDRVDRSEPPAARHQWRIAVRGAALMTGATWRKRHRGCCSPSTAACGSVAWVGERKDVLVASSGC
jgi:hypothetical protein